MARHFTHAVRALSKCSVALSSLKQKSTTTLILTIQKCNQHNSRRRIIFAAAGIGLSSGLISSLNSKTVSIHELHEETCRKLHSVAIDQPGNAQTDSLHQANLGRFWLIRLSLRAARLLLTFVPLAVLYPLATLIHVRCAHLWWSAMYLAIQTGGPTLIKLAQWAATRRDLFSAEFCNRFGQLQHRAKPESWTKSKRVFEQTFGENWRSLFADFEINPAGCGCIAQVYKATMLTEKTPIDGHDTESMHQNKLTVAIKVTHESVLESIHMDMLLLRSVARIAQAIIPSMFYINPVKCVRDFQNMMERQTDLRHECFALKIFAHNFRNNPWVKFPTPIFCTDRMIIETFEEGVHIGEYIPQQNTNSDQINNVSSSVDNNERLNQLRSHLAVTGVRAVCQMILTDNFVHGDLHPGNILVQQQTKEDYQSQTSGNFTKMFEELKSRLMTLVSGSSEKGPDMKRMPRLVFLDTGITVQLQQSDRHNFSAAFRALLDLNGYRIGQLLLEHAPRKLHWCTQPEMFCEEIEALLVKASHGKNQLCFRTMHISNLVSDLLSIVSKHKVPLVPDYAVVLLAVGVLEGLGRSLDPDLDLLHCARPFAFELIGG